jgi:hypothetical protein
MVMHLEEEKNTKMKNKQKNITKAVKPGKTLAGRIQKVPKNRHEIAYMAGPFK